MNKTYNKKAYKITTLNGAERASTQSLIMEIDAKIKEGYRIFEIEASGQHDIGGSSWTKDGEPLEFYVKNPGQRVGAMAMNNTKIVVDGSAPADVGWLNSGAEIIVKGDAGDTCAHCAAGGKIYVAGRVGTRSGALMKQDPAFEAPQFWILKNTGSFAFEFMGGGTAVVCGLDCEDLPSVLGERACVGMVGGVVYFRGNVENIAPCVEICAPDDSDKEFLLSGLKDFLEKIERLDAINVLSDMSLWKKITVKRETNQSLPSLKDFRENNWIKGGIFSDFIKDDFNVLPLAATGEGRLNIPIYDSKECVKCGLCEKNCPQKAIITENDGYKSLDEKCIGCGICEAVCPKKCWQMQTNIREIN